MSKYYLGSSKLSNNFKLIRIRYRSPQEMFTTKEEIQRIMDKFLQDHDGKLMNIVDLPNCNELMVYFITGDESRISNWPHFIKNELFPKFQVLPSTVEIGPRLH